MSHNSGTRRALARGGMYFAAVTLLVSGVFQILMGISNAVYFGSKVAQPGANTAAANPAPAAADATPATPQPS